MANGETTGNELIEEQELNTGTTGNGQGTDETTADGQSKQQASPSPKNTYPETPAEKLQALHSRLLSVQQQSNMEGVPEDFGTFDQWFADPSYRKEFHTFLMDQQQRGRIEGIPEDYIEFETKMTGQPSAAETLGRGPLTGMDLPSELRQLDLDVDEAAETAFDSTEALDQYDSLEAWKGAEAEKAAKAVSEYLGGERGEDGRQADQGRPYFTRGTGQLHFPEADKKRILQKRKERADQQALAELQYQEASKDYMSGNISEQEYQQQLKNIEWPKAGVVEAFGKGFARTLISDIPSLVAEFAGHLYYHPLDSPINGPDENTKAARKDFLKAADWFKSLGQDELLRINRNIEGKGLADVWENPALLPSWLAAHTGSGVATTVPVLSIMKVLAPVTKLGQFLAATAGSAPLEVGGQLQDLRKSAEADKRNITEGDKILAVASGLASASLEGFADRYLFVLLEDALKKSGLGKAAKEQIKKEVGKRLSERLWVILKNGGRQFTIESITESMQQIIQNIGADFGWDPGRPLLQGVPESAVIGGTTGGLMGVSFGLAGEYMHQRNSLISSMEPNASAQPGPIAPVTFEVPVDGDINNQIQAVQSERERIRQEKIQAEKNKQPTLDHDMALSQLAIIESNIQKQMDQGRKEAVELKVRSEQEGPEFRRTEEAQKRRRQALGEGTVLARPRTPLGQREGQAQPVEGQTAPEQVGGQPPTAPEVPTDVAGQEIISPEEFTEMSPEERRDYAKPIKRTINQPAGGSVEIDAGLAPFASEVAAMGFQIESGDSGLQVDHPGSRQPETGELQNRGANARLSFTAPDVAGSANTSQNIANVQQAAQEAGFNVQQTDVPFRPGLTISLPAVADGTPQTALTQEANEITNARWEGLRGENLDLWLRRRDSILEEEVIPRHGGQRQWSDDQVLDRWEAFTQNLQRLEGQAPDQRTSFEVDTEAAPAEQVQQARQELQRLRRNRQIAENRGADTAPFDQAIDRLTDIRNQARNEQRQQLRSEAAGQATIEETLGQTVTMGEYTGTLSQDEHGTIIIDTGEQIVEVPDTRKDTSLSLSEAGVVPAAPATERIMELTDPAQDRFQFTERDPLTGLTKRETEFTFLESNTNDTGEVVSVMMSDPEGNRRTFRDPDVVEQVIWQKYFREGTPVQQTEATLEENIMQAEQEMVEEDTEPDFTLDDGDPRIETVFNKFEQGQPLTPQEQINALDWVQEKMDQLVEENPADGDLYFNYLTAFENEITQNNPQAPDTQQQRELEDEGEVSPTAAQTPTQVAATQQGLAPQAAELMADIQAGQVIPTQGLVSANPRMAEVAAAQGISITPGLTEQQLANELRLRQQAPQVDPATMTAEDYLSEQVEALPDQVQADPDLVAYHINNKFIPQHRQAVARALEQGQDVPEKILADYSDLLNQTATPTEQTESPNGIERSRRLVKDMTEEKFQQVLSEQTDLSQEQLNTVIDLVRVRAQVWAKQNGWPEAEYWRRRLSGIERSLPVGTDQVNDIIGSYGEDVAGMPDVENKVNERLEYNPDDYEFTAQSAIGPDVPYNSARRMGFLEESVPDEALIPVPGQREILGEGGEFILQERQFYPNENWTFTAPRQITSTHDVAWMFAALEHQQTEHVFLVGVDREGNTHNVHLGSGNETSAQVDAEAVPAIVSRLGLQQVWLVHNHPSGLTGPSQADRVLWGRLRLAMPTGIAMMDGVIIDRDSGYYGTFNGRYDSAQQIENTQQRQAFAEGNPDYFTNQPVQNYDRVRQLHRAAFAARPTMGNARDVARFADHTRFGLTDRFSAVVLDDSNRVLGLVHLKSVPDLDDTTGMSQKQFADELRAYIGRLGGKHAVLATNQDVSTFRRHKGWMNELSTDMARSGFTLSDVINVAATPDQQQTFASMRSDGVFTPLRSYMPYQSDTRLRDSGAELSTGEEGIIQLFEDTDDFESVIRGLGSIFRQDMAPDDINAVEDWLGIEEGNWTPENDQSFTDGFIAYLSQPEQSKAPAKVKGIFAKIKEWISGVYQSLLQNDQAVVIPDDVRQALDRLFTSPTEELRNSSEIFSDVGMAINVNFKADGSEQTQGRFAVIEARDLQASHNSDGSLNSRHVISKGQPRDRRGRKYVAQHKEIAQKLNPASITGNGATAFYGSPTTNMRGEVIQGNGRSITLQIAYSENPGKATKYKDYLIAHAEEWGLSPDAIGSMQRPVLVRALDVKDNEAVRLGNIKNTDEAKMDLLDEAKASVRNMPEADRQRIGNIMNSSESETLRGILDDIGPQIIDLLPDISRAEYMDAENNITVKGKDFLTDVFRSLVFDSEQGRDTVRKFSEMAHDIIRGIERSYGTLIRYVNTPADLSVTLQNAVDIVWNVRKNKNMSTASDFVNQQDVFATTDQAYTPREVALAQVLLDTQNPSSELMKNLGTSGTQKAIRTLIRDYANRIDGETDLFTQGQTPDDAAVSPEQAFDETFGTTQPQGAQREGPRGEPGTRTFRAGNPPDSRTGLASLRYSGIDNITELTPDNPQTPQWLEEKPASKKAVRLLKKFDKDPDGNTIGIRSVFNFFNDQLGVDMRVGKAGTSRKNPANLSERSFINRTRSPLDVAVFHEGGHAMHVMAQASDPYFLDRFEWSELMSRLEAEGLSRASADINEEYFAEWVRTYIMNPVFAGSLELTTNLEQALQESDPELLAALRDTARLYQAHHRRGPEAKTRSASADIGPEPKTLWEGIKDEADAFKFGWMARNWTIDQWERDAVWKAFRAAYDKRSEANRMAREFLGSIRMTEGDFRLAHQVTNRIPGIVRDAMYGKGFKIFTTGNQRQATPEDIGRLKKVMNIPEKLEKALTNPATRHGEVIAMTDKSIGDTLEKIGRKQWQEFEWYAQHKVSLERLIAGKSTYPGITDTSPRSVAEKVAEKERAHPEWQGYFQEINDYMDRLVLSAFLGGLIDINEAERILGSYEFYMPLTRQLEQQFSNLYGSERRGTDAGGVPTADPGFRSLTGEGDHPFLPLLEAIEGRTYQAVDAYYQNRAMMAPVLMVEELNKREDIPAAAKIPANQLLTPIPIGSQKVADMTPSEMADVVAQWLNEQAQAERAELPESVQATLPELTEITREDIVIAGAAKEIWRGHVKAGIHIFAPKRDGNMELYQLKDPHMYDYFARTHDAQGVINFWNGVARGTAPWKQLLTSTFDFLTAATMRGVVSNMVLADLPEYTIDRMSTGEYIRTTIPGYRIARGAAVQLVESRGAEWLKSHNVVFEKIIGFLAGITGTTEGNVVDTELLSNNFQHAFSAQRRLTSNAFARFMSQGVLDEGWHQRSTAGKAGHIGWIAPMNIVAKPFLGALKITGLDALSTAMEGGQRKGAYVDARGRGFPPEVAAMFHDHTGGNFGERPGRADVHAAYRASGFGNPTMQVISEILRRATSPDYRIPLHMVLRLGNIAIFTTAIWAASRLATDDEREEELQERTTSEKLNYMPLFGMYRVPFDYGIPGAVQSFTWNMLDRIADEKDVPADEFAKSIIKRLADTPVNVYSPSGATSSLLQMAFGPQATTMIEATAGYKFYWEQPIVPPELQFKIPENQAYITTPGFYKALGQMSGWSPLKIQHVFNGLTGSLLTRGLKFAEAVGRGEPVDPADYPIGGKLVQRTPSGWFSQSAQKVSELNRQYIALEQQRDQLQEADTNDPEQIKRIRELDRQVSQLAFFNEAAKRLARKYDTVKALREQGEYEQAEMIEKQMVEMAAGFLSMSGALADENSDEN